EAVAAVVLYTGRITGKSQTQYMKLCTVTGIQVGTGDFGISPGEGTIRMTLRAEIEEEMLEMEQKILRYAGEQADRHGLQISHHIFDYFPETRNSEIGLERVLAAAAKLQLQTSEMPELWRASEDFGWYLKKCPGAMFYVGTGEDWPALHTKEYDFNDRILEPAVDLFLQLAKQN
ncbi:MAG: amidohydrolase, partial [Eubacterium sp.]|nr:amidohydrolase [Eubacterium sp.]